MKMPARIRNSWFVIVLVLLSMAPGALAFTVHDDRDKKKCRYDDCKVAVAEGGNAGLYLLLAGVSCLGAMSFRSRKSEQTDV